MEGELAAEGLFREVRILGVNAPGQESANDAVVEGRSLPWLQDREEVGAWQRWGARAGDVIILDAENRRAAVHSCSENDLDEPGGYEQLKAVLRDLAGP